MWVSLLLFRAGLLVQPLYERGKDIASLVLRRNKLGRYDILFPSWMNQLCLFEAAQLDLAIASAYREGWLGVDGWTIGYTSVTQAEA